MNNLQFFSAIVIAPSMTILVVIVAALFNNARLTDLKELFRAELHKEIQAAEVRLQAKMDEHLRIVLGKIEELERRRG